MIEYHKAECPGIQLEYEMGLDPNKHFQLRQFESYARAYHFINSKVLLSPYYLLMLAYHQMG